MPNHHLGTADLWRTLPPPPVARITVAADRAAMHTTHVSPAS